MKTLLSILLLTACFSCFSQEKLRVRYQTQFLVLTNQMDKDENPIAQWTASGPQYELNVAGNLSAFKSIPLRNVYTDAASRKGNIYMEVTPAQVFNYTNVTSKRLYTPVPSLTEKALMVDDSIVVYNWIFTEVTDTVCGFACRMAAAPYSEGYVYAWYAYEFPHSFGPFAYTGLPGTVLAVEFSEKPLRYIAIDVNEEATPVQIPETAYISSENYEALSKEKRKYRAGLFGKRVDPREVPRITPTGNPTENVYSPGVQNTNYDPFLPIRPYKL